MESHAATRQVGNAAIVDLSGSITIAGGTGLLRNKINELVTAGHKNILLNLRDIKYLDSAGMGELVGVCTTLRNLGGDLKLVSPQQRIRNLLEVTKLATIFSIYPDEAAALGSL